MNTLQKGDWSELLVLTELIRLGRKVAIPYGNSPGYDLLVLGTDGKWKSIQVKTAHRRGKRGNRIYVDTIRGNGQFKKRGYDHGAFDFMVAVLPDENRFWVMDFGEMYGRRCITMGEERAPHWDRI